MTSAARTQAVTANGQDVELSASRLRATWPVAAMSAPVPLGALLGAAGLRSARTLVDLVPYCPRPHRRTSRACCGWSRTRAQVPGRSSGRQRDDPALHPRPHDRRGPSHRDPPRPGRHVEPERHRPPRQLKVDVFLAGVLLTVGDKRPLTLVNVHATLTKNLALSARIALGTEYRPGPGAEPRSLSIRQVRYLLEAIEKRLAYTEGRLPDLAPEDREVRAGALQHVLDKIIEASLPEHLPRPASLALDDRPRVLGQRQEAIGGRGIGRFGTGDSRDIFWLRRARLGRDRRRELLLRP